MAFFNIGKVGNIREVLFQNSNFILWFFCLLVGSFALLFIFNEAKKRLQNTSVGRKKIIEFLLGVFSCVSFIFVYISIHHRNSSEENIINQEIFSSFYCLISLGILLIVCSAIFNIYAVLGIMIPVLVLNFILPNSFVFCYPFDFGSQEKRIIFQTLFLLIIFISFLFLNLIIKKLKFVFFKLSFGKYLILFFIICLLDNLILASISGFNRYLTISTIYLLINNSLLFLILLITMIVQKYFEYQTNYIRDSKFIKKNVYFEKYLISEITKIQNKEKKYLYGLYGLFVNSQPGKTKYIKYSSDLGKKIIHEYNDALVIEKDNWKNKFFFFVDKKSNLGLFLLEENLEDIVHKKENKLEIVRDKIRKQFNNKTLLKNKITLIFSIYGMHSDSFKMLNSLVYRQFSPYSLTKISNNLYIFDLVWNLESYQSTKTIKIAYGNEHYYKYLSTYIFKIMKNEDTVGIFLKTKLNSFFAPDYIKNNYLSLYRHVVSKTINDRIYSKQKNQKILLFFKFYITKEFLKKPIFNEIDKFKNLKAKKISFSLILCFNYNLLFENDYLIKQLIIFINGLKESNISFCFYDVELSNHFLQLIKISDPQYLFLNNDLSDEITSKNDEKVLKLLSQICSSRIILNNRNQEFSKNLNRDIFYVNTNPTLLKNKNK